MTYATKSSLAALGALILVYGGYFLWALPVGRRTPEVLAHMIGAVILMTVIMIAAEIAIALDELRRDQSAGRTDERDRIVGLRSARNGYYALLAVVWFVPFAVLAGMSPIVLANLSLGMLVAAEAVRFASRIIYGALA
jgi:hypothetical protein